LVESTSAKATIGWVSMENNFEEREVLKEKVFVLEVDLDDLFEV